MNLVGKIFTVLIFVMSLVFMSFVVAVYATHKNWRDVVLNPEDKVTADKPVGLTFQLKKARSTNEELKTELEKQQADLAAEKAAKRQQLAKLEQEYTELKREHADLEKERAALDLKLRDSVSAMQATQTNAANLRKEVEGLRTDIEKAQKDRDAHFKEVVRLTDELHQAVNDLQQLKKRNVALAEDLARVSNMVRALGHNPTEELAAALPVETQGVVLGIRDSGLIEISIGSDDSVRKGHILDIVRVAGGTSTYVGRCEVLETAPNRAVCKVDPKTLKSPVQRDDRVFTKLTK